MSSVRSSLNNSWPGYYEVPALIVLSAACLAAGLTMPVILLKELVFWKHTYSVLTGVQSLWNENERLLAVVIFLFSVIFPAIKLSMLSVLWYWKFTEARRRFLIDWIGQLGKWSMLDVFVLAITIVITKTSKFVEAEPKPGIYVFAASILLAMIVTMRVEYLAKKH